MEKYYADIWNLTQILNNLVNSYRLLIGGAAELNTITVAHTNEVKDALDLVDDLGDVIDDVIDALEKSSDYYFDYCKKKSQLLKESADGNIIITEVEEELDFNNSQKDEGRVPKCEKEE